MAKRQSHLIMVSYWETVFIQAECNDGNIQEVFGHLNCV